jgi:hypothetical protein
MPGKPKTADKKRAAPVKPAAPNKAAEALQLVRREAEALDADELARINVDVSVAVSTALGALGNLRAMRDAIASELPNHPIDTIDRLESYALAAWYVHLLSQPTAKAPDTVAALEEEAIPLRELLLSDAGALAKRGKLDAQTVADSRAGSGQIDRANDLVALFALFTSAWPDISDKTAATEAEVRRAGELGPLLLAALGAREHATAASASGLADLRRRTFTLFVNAYDQCRRAATYLRWDAGDADELVPSLWKGRGGSRAKAEPADEGESGSDDGKTGGNE